MALRTAANLCSEGLTHGEARLGTAGVCVFVCLCVFVYVLWFKERPSAFNVSGKEKSNEIQQFF